MNIGIDIDDTITKTSEELDILAKEYTENILKRKFELNKIEVIDPMWAKYLYNWNDQEEKAFWDLYYEKAMTNVKPKDGAIETINNLAKNNEIIVITARWENENGKIATITRNWLQKYGIKYNKLFLGYEDKRELVRANNIEIFIDDNYKTCKLVSETNVRTLIMDSRLNRNMKDDKLERVFSWQDIEEKLK